MNRFIAKISFISTILSGLLFTSVAISSGTEKSNEKGNGVSAEKTTEKTVEKTAEKTTEKGSEKEGAANEAKHASTEPGAEHGKEKEEEKDPKLDASNPDACLVDQTALEDLKKRRSELEKKNKELAERETELKSRERAVEEQIKKMEEVRDQITKGDDLKKKENQEKIAKIVETIESMSPKAAANLIASIDETLAIAAITQVSTPKLAKMMNIMEPARAFRLTELLAGVTRAKRPTSPVVKTDVAAVTKAERGGEIENANNTESKTKGKGSSSGREPASNAGREKPGK